MRFLLLYIVILAYSSLSFSKAISSKIDNLNGEFSFTEGNLLSSSIETSLTQTDNFLRSQDNNQTITTGELSPELFIQKQSAGSLFQLQAAGKYQANSNFSQDNHLDYSLLSKFHLRFAQSQKVFVTGFITDKYEARGTGLSLGDADSLVEGDSKRNKFFNVGYLYGHEDSQARAKFIAGYRDFGYQTRKSVTQHLSYSSQYFQGNFDYLMSGKTYFSTKIEYEDFSYRNNDELERQQYQALAGVKWRSTELTQLHLLFGYEKTFFANNAFAEEDRFAWQVNFLWSPLERLRLNVNSGTSIKDSYKITQSINFADSYGLTVSYDVNERLTLQFSGKLVHEDVVATDNTTSEDHIENSLGMQYQWQHWLSVFARYQYDSFDADIVTNNYDVQALSTGVVITF